MTQCVTGVKLNYGNQTKCFASSVTSREYLCQMFCIVCLCCRFVYIEFYPADLQCCFSCAEIKNCVCIMLICLSPHPISPPSLSVSLFAFLFSLPTFAPSLLFLLLCFLPREVPLAFVVKMVWWC